MSARAAALELDAALVARVFPGVVDTPLLRAVLDADGRVSEPGSVPPG